MLYGVSSLMVQPVVELVFWTVRQRVDYFLRSYLSFLGNVQNGRMFLNDFVAVMCSKLQELFKRELYLQYLSHWFFSPPLASNELELSDIEKDLSSVFCHLWTEHGSYKGWTENSEDDQSNKPILTYLTWLNTYSACKFWTTKWHHVNSSVHCPYIHLSST